MNLTSFVYNTEGGGWEAGMWNFQYIPKLRRLDRWRLGIDNEFHPTHYNGCDYFPMLGLKLDHASR